MLEFASSAQSTVGVEWEFALVDADSGDLVCAAPEVLEAAQADAHLAEHVTGEYLANTVEVISSAHRRVPDVVAELGVLTERLHELTSAQGMRLFGAGTHPFARCEEQRVSDNERYERVAEHHAWWGQQLLIWGVHVHVGVDRREKVWPLVQALLGHLPQLLALSGSSPIWQGQDTGYASQRSMLYQQIPSAGLPWLFDTWEEFQEYYDVAVSAGLVASPKDLRWDIRPSPKWGTVEVRVCDGIATLAELGALTAYVQCLADDYSHRLDRSEALPSLPQWFHAENKWRAARFGLDADMIVTAAGEQRPVRDAVAADVERLAPIAARLGCAEELQYVLQIAERGPSYQRQRAVFERAGSPLAVVQHVIAEFAAGHPL